MLIFTLILMLILTPCQAEGLPRYVTKSHAKGGLMYQDDDEGTKTVRRKHAAF